MTILDYRATDPMKGGASFSLSHRIERFVWDFVWVTFGKWTPAPLFGWRRALAALFGARLARTVKIYPGVRIWYPRNLEMGEHTCLGARVSCYSMAKVTVADYAVVSQDAELCAGTHNVDDDYFQLVAKPVVVGRRAWIAAGAFVGPGVTVGDGAVLGARAVAMKSLEPLTIYAGNPARPLRQRRIDLDRPL